MRKKFICIFISIGILSYMPAYANELKLYVDNQEVYTDVAPFVKDGRTFTPARAVAEAMGGTVLWDEVTQSVRIFNTAIQDLKYSAYAIHLAKNGEALYWKISTLVDNLEYYKYRLKNGLDSDYYEKGDKEFLNNLYLEIDDKYKDTFYNFAKSGVLNVDDIDGAFSAYKSALENVEKCFDIVKKNPYANIDELLILITTDSSKGSEYFSNILSDLIIFVYNY